MADDLLAPTERTTLRRLAERGSHDRSVIRAILDAGLICHVGFAVGERPWVFPTAYAVVDDDVVIHGAVGNFGLRAIAGGAEGCLTVTVVDGLVLARSAFHHSMNYRSVMVFGRGTGIEDPDAKRRAVLAIVDHMAAGRAGDTRGPTDSELRRTLVVRIPLSEASAKVRTGGPQEEPEDIGLSHWAGVLPLGLTAGTPAPDLVDRADASLATPDYVSSWSR